MVPLENSGEEGLIDDGGFDYDGFDFGYGGDGRDIWYPLP